MKRKVMMALFAVALLALLWLIFPHGERNFIWNPDTLFLHDDDEPFGCELFDKMAEATLPNGYSYYQGSLDDLLSSKEKRSLLLVCGEVSWDEYAAIRIDSFIRRGNNLMLVCNECYGVGDYAWGSDRRTKDFFKKDDLREVLKGHQAPDMLYCTNGDRIPVPRPLLTSFFGTKSKATHTSSIGPVLSKSALVKRKAKEMGAVRFTYDGDTVTVPDPYETDSSLVMDYRSKEDFEDAIRSARESLEEYMHNDVSNEYVSLTVNVGKGKVFLLTSPLLFTNYGVLDTHISKFVGWQLSQIADRPVVRFSHALVNQHFSHSNDPSGISSSPLYYMLDRPPLRWAIYTLLAAIVLFMLFTARRRQRRIPVIDTPQNRNLSFVQLLGTIYYRRHDNADLLRKKYTYFREELRRTMLLDIDDTSADASHQARLAQKTGMEEARIAETLGMVRRLTAEREYLSDRQLQECIDRMNEIIKKL